MKNKISTAKLNIMILSWFYSLTCVYGVLLSFDAEGLVLYASVALCALIILVFLYKKYKPFVKESRLNGNYLFLDGKYIYDYQIISVYEVGPSGKASFVIKNPQFDYTSSFLSKGLVVKTIYDSLLIDNTDREYIESKRVARTLSIKLNSALFYGLSLLPFVFLFICLLTGIDPLWYVFLMLVLVFTVFFRLLPPFYLGTKLTGDDLPLKPDEINEFKNITIIKGFVLSDKLSILPFSKRSYLDGLALDIFVKRFIILNPRLFMMNSDDYIRFVLFHELCHIKHHDGSMGVIVPSLIILLDIILSFFPTGIVDYIPYYDYILLGAAALWIVYAILSRKKIERRADKYGVDRIGKNGIANIHRELGIDIK